MSLIGEISDQGNKVVYKSHQNGFVIFSKGYIVDSHKSDKKFNFPASISIDGYQSDEMVISSVEELDELIEILNKHRADLQPQKEVDEAYNAWREENHVKKW